MVDVKKFKWKNDNYKIEYWGDDLKQTASINFTESLNVDLSILDMVSFNEEGKAILNLSNENIRLGHFSSSLKARYTFIIDTFKSSLDNLFQLISKLNMEESDVEIEATLINNLSQKVVIIGDKQVKKIVNNDSFNFSIRRIKRLRNPYARFVLEKYMRHLTRSAEQHDFAKNK